MSTVKLLTSVDGAPSGALLHRDYPYVSELVAEGKATWDTANGFDWPKASDISAFGPYASVAQLEAAYPAALYPNGIGQVSANGATSMYFVSGGKWLASVGADFNPLTGGSNISGADGTLAVSGGTDRVFFGGSTEASVRAAALAAIAIGGGEIRLPAYLAITQPLPISKTAPLTYRGPVASEVFFWSLGPQLGGCTIDCQNLGINAFEWNAVDLGASLASAEDTHATEARGLGLYDINIINCKNGVRFGGNFNGGVSGLKMDNITVWNASEWGFWLENCHRPQIGAIQAHECGVGHVMVLSSTSNFHYGNGTIRQIHTIAQSANRRCRMIVIGARNGSELNDIAFGQLIAVEGATVASVTGIVATASEDLPVPDLSKFAVGLPFYVSTSSGGFSANRVYWVTAVSGTSGAGTIKCSYYPGGANKTMTAGALGTLYIKGGTGIEIGSLDAASKVTGMAVLNTDTEACGIANITLNRVYESNINIGLQDPATANQRQVVVRNCDDSTHIYSTGPITNGDFESWTVSVTGGRVATPVNAVPSGVRVNHDSATTTSALYLGGPSVTNTRALRVLADGVLNPVASDKPWANAPSYIASSGTIDGTHTSLVIYTGAAGGSFTLPAISANNCGIWYKLVNPTAGSITVNTSSGQTVNNVSGTTSITIPANSSVLVQSAQTTSSSGVFFWQT